ncbi:MAG: TRAP transporter large permease subunit, partial [Clostridiales bacterium]|nr:TRAP transporter large permease subunit [Clostridiales bacterium]
SVSALFVATVIPGIMWGVGYMIVNRIVYRKWYDPTRVGQNEAAFETQQKVREAQQTPSKWKATKTAIPAFLMAVIILVGIYGGIFSPTEAGGVSALYALIVGVFVYRKLKGKNTWSTFTSTGMSLGSLMVILPFAMIFSKILVLLGAPTVVTNLLTGITDNRVVLLIIIDIFLIICGCFFEAPILTMVLPPILMPTLTMLGVGPNQFGVIVFMAVGIGALTPPMAVPLFVGCRIGRVSIKEVIKPLLPLLICVAVPIMLLVTFIPELTLWLPNVLLDATFA